MRVKLEDLSPEDRKKHIGLYLWAETARCSVLSPDDTYRALAEELVFISSLPERYDLPEDVDWELDPVLGAIYERSE